MATNGGYCAADFERRKKVALEACLNVRATSRRASPSSIETSCTSCLSAMDLRDQRSKAKADKESNECLNCEKLKQKLHHPLRAFRQLITAHCNISRTPL